MRPAAPDMDIIVEIHSLLDANTAAELGKALEPLHIMYFEEPTSPENPQQLPPHQARNATCLWGNG